MYSFNFPDMILEGESIDSFDPPWISLWFMNCIIDVLRIFVINFTITCSKRHMCVYDPTEAALQTFYYFHEHLLYYLLHY